MHWVIHVNEGEHSLLQHLDVHLATQFSAFHVYHVSLYNLHTICYSSELEEPLIHDDEDTCRHSILHALLFVVL